MNKQMIGPQITGVDSMGNALYREPVFDLKIKAQKRNPFSKMEENERAKELYSMGFFAPEKAQESLMALDMMDFEGKDFVLRAIRNNAREMAETATRPSEPEGKLRGGETPGVLQARLRTAEAGRPR